MHCHLWPDLTATCASPAPGQKISVNMFWCCHVTHFLFGKNKVNMVKPVPWTNSCVISIQSYLLCRTCGKQHRHTQMTVPFFHPSETLCNTSERFSFKEYFSVFFPFWRKKNALSFSQKIPATPKSKISELKILIKEEETWELQRALISKGLQLTEEEESWARNVSSNESLLSTFTISSTNSFIKCEVWLVLLAPIHSALLCTFKNKKKAAAPDFHTGRDQPHRTPGCAPGSQSPFTFVVLAHFKQTNPANLCARYCEQAPVCSQGRLATSLVKYHATHAALCLSPSSLVGMQSEPGGAMERQNKRFKKTGRETAQKEQQFLHFQLLLLYSCFYTYS